MPKKTSVYRGEVLLIIPLLGRLCTLTPVLFIINITELTIFCSIIKLMAKSQEFSEIDISQITTYQSGIAQASAHRIINRLVSDYLLKHGLTAMQWFALGTIYDAGDQGIRLSDLTRKLSTTLPYVTNMVALLESKGTVRKIAHGGDSRIKLVSVAPKYKRTVENIERELREHMRTNLYEQGVISREELQSYTSVLYKIVRR